MSGNRRQRSERGERREERLTEYQMRREAVQSQSAPERKNPLVGSNELLMKVRRPFVTLLMVGKAEAKEGLACLITVASNRRPASVET
jgi:hypothetical protein